ncbi:reverse transcriptase domain-containing protein [Tanacetum coccineum]
MNRALGQAGNQLALEGSRNNRNNGNQVRGRAYNVNVNAMEAVQDPNVVTGTFSMNDHFVTVLFDSGADFSFISTEFAPLLNVKPSIVNPGYVIEVADGKKVEVDRVMIWIGGVRLPNGSEGYAYPIYVMIWIGGVRLPNGSEGYAYPIYDMIQIGGVSFMRILRLREVARATARIALEFAPEYGKLQSIKCAIAGKNTVGMNMVSKGVQNVIDYLQTDYPDICRHGHLRYSEVELWSNELELHSEFKNQAQLLSDCGVMKDGLGTHVTASFSAGFVVVVNTKVAEGVKPPCKGAVDCARNTVKAEMDEGQNAYKGVSVKDTW